MHCFDLELKQNYMCLLKVESDTGEKKYISSRRQVLHSDKTLCREFLQEVRYWNASKVIQSPSKSWCFYNVCLQFAVDVNFEGVSFVHLPGNLNIGWITWSRWRLFVFSVVLLKTLNKCCDFSGTILVHDR